MLRWLSFFGAVAVVAAGVVFYLYKGPPPTAAFITAPNVGVPRAQAPAADGKNAEAAPPKRAENESPAAPGPWTREVGVQPRIVMTGARLIPDEVREVPSMQDGQLLFLATEIDVKPGAEPPAGAFKQVVPSLYVEVTELKSGEAQGPDWVVLDNKWCRPLQKGDDVRPNRIKLYRGEKWFVRLDEGTKVQDGQIVGMLDPATAVDELSIRLAKLDAAEADRLASEKIKEYYKAILNRQLELQRKNAATAQEVDEARAGYEKTAQEVISKAEAVKVAGKELRQAETLLEQYVIRSKIKGEIKELRRHGGEATRKGDMVLFMEDHAKVRIRGKVDLQDLQTLQEPGTVVHVEAMRLVPPQRVLTGHFGEVTGVAVSKDNQIVSVSEDRTARVWERDLKLRRERLVVRHPAAIRAVACTPAAADSNCFLTGAADGIARLYDLASGDKPFVREFRDANGHKEAINSVAFSPDGRWAATGGDDRAVCLWEVDSGKLLQHFPADSGHKGGVTSVTFLTVGPEKKLSVVSAGRDNALIVWPLSGDGVPEKPIRLERRGGEVTTLGVNPNGLQLLFDQGKELRVLSSENGALVGSLSATGGASFNRLALFSPEGNLILTSGGAGRLGLWRAPTADSRRHELEQMVWTSNRDDQAVTNCGSFAPDSSFIVTGTQNRNVIVWPMPAKKDVEQHLTAKVLNLDPEVNSGQVKVLAQMDNPGYLLPGDVVTLVVYPQK